MTALILNFLRPYFLQIGIGVAVAIGVTGAAVYIHHKIYAEGETAERAKVDRQNAGAKDAADKAAADADACDATGRVWNVATGKCDGP